MGTDLSKVSMLARREIEARIAGPLIKAFMEEFGQEETKEIVERVIQRLARENGAQLAKRVGGNSIEHFSKVGEIMSQDDGVREEVLEQDSTKRFFNCTRCRFAEMYKELGMEDLGYLLSCSRDFAMVEGFNRNMRLKRTQTIMQGGDYCDFRLYLEEE